MRNGKYEGEVFEDNDGHRRRIWMFNVDRNPPRYEWYTVTKWNDGKWHEHPKNKLYWTRLPYFILAFQHKRGDVGSSYLPMRTSLKLVLRLFYNNYGYRYLWNLIKEYLREDSGPDGEDIGLRAIWKQVTLQIIRTIIEAIPFPIPEVEQFADDLMMMLAEKFYDFLFSIEL
jgi:hypothetical protein